MQVPGSRTNSSSSSGRPALPPRARTETPPIIPPRSLSSPPVAASPPVTRKPPPPLPPSTIYERMATTAPRTFQNAPTDGPDDDDDDDPNGVDAPYVELLETEMNEEVMNEVRQLGEERKREQELLDEVSPIFFWWLRLHIVHACF